MKRNNTVHYSDILAKLTQRLATKTLIRLMLQMNIKSKAFPSVIKTQWEDGMLGLLSQFDIQHN
jgi:hypothetical protein